MMLTEYTPEGEVHTNTDEITIDEMIAIGEEVGFKEIFHRIRKDLETSPELLGQILQCLDAPFIALCMIGDWAEVRNYLEIRVNSNDLDSIEYDIIIAQIPTPPKEIIEKD